jgi:nitrogenase subunit NifH
VDCPPTIGYLTFNALRAADEALVPIETGYFAFKAAERQLSTIDALVRQIGRPLAVRIVPTLHRSESQLSHDILNAIGRRYGALSSTAVIRDHAVLREAASFGQSVVEFAPGSGAHQDFKELADWISTQTVQTRTPNSSTSPQLLSIEIDRDALPAVYVGQQHIGHGRAAELAHRLRLSGTSNTAAETG